MTSGSSIHPNFSYRISILYPSDRDYASGMNEEVERAIGSTHLSPSSQRKLGSRVGDLSICRPWILLMVPIHQRVRMTPMKTTGARSRHAIRNKMLMLRKRNHQPQQRQGVGDEDTRPHLRTALRAHDKGPAFVGAVKTVGSHDARRR